MKRRHWLHSLAGMLTVSALPHRAAFPAEKYDKKWTKEWIVKYSMALVDWLKADLGRRTGQMELLVDIKVPLNFQYFAEPLAGKDKEFHDRFLNWRLSDKDTLDHIAGFLKELEANRAAVAAKEAEAAQKWKSELGGDVPLKDGKIYEEQISSRRLGVILDSSPSMAPYVEKLRVEIGRDFDGCHIVEVDGCEIWEGGGNVPWFYTAPAAGINPFTADRFCPAVPQTDAHEAWAYYFRDTTSAFTAMLDQMKVDAIYWFCDFDDPIDDFVVQQLSKAMLEKQVKLYAHTLSKSPPNSLTTLIERSGGKLIRKRLR